MGLITAEIELINGGDLEMVRRNLMDKDEVKRMWVNTLIDTGAIMLCINENFRHNYNSPSLTKERPS